MLTLETAQALIAAGIEEATRNGFKLAFAVVDEGGHVVATARMDGAPWIAPEVALGKAWTAAAYGAPSAAQATPNTAGLPDNYALTSSAQSLLNRPGVDAVPAFAQLAKYGQLPGQGEIITNVSLGTLTDASEASDPSDPCNFYAANYGPTTVVQNAQVAPSSGERDVAP